MKARAPPFERDPGVPAEGVPPRRYCRAPTRPRTFALYGAKAPSERARAPRARDCMPARASTCDDIYTFAAVQFALPSSGARRRRGAALLADRRQPTHPPSTATTAGAQGYYWAANSAPGGASRRPCRVLQHDQELRARLALLVRCLSRLPRGVRQPGAPLPRAPDQCTPAGAAARAHGCSATD